MHTAAAVSPSADRYEEWVLQDQFAALKQVRSGLRDGMLSLELTLMD